MTGHALPGDRVTHRESRPNEQCGIDIGYFANAEYVLGSSLAGAVAEQRRTVRAAYELDYHAVFVGEHLSRQNSVWLPPLLLLSHIYPDGPGMHFGTSVLAAGLHHPVMLAEEIAFHDVLTGGRFALGLSAGWNKQEFDSLSASFTGRTKRLEETIEILRSLWQAREPLTFRGHTHEFNDVYLSLKPAQPAGVPIWVGASSDKALKRAARLGDAWIVSSHLSSAEVAHQAEAFRRYRRGAGKPLPSKRPGIRNVFVGRTAEEAVAKAGPHGTAVSDHSADNTHGVIVGDCDGVALQLVKFLRESDVNLLLIRSHWLGIGMDNVIDTLSLIAQEVIPKVRGELER